uniref:Reverse transcriptase N-terminal domain-containing protein n=1 Tax=Laurencia snackeyi TaxID=1858662 RepID=A0A0G4KBL0_9FLOR|nr:Hypothetical protein orf371 [Laurencia snackeyi]
MVNIKICPQKFSLERISLRILMIQKQIYVAAKKHRLSYLYELQKYLINSNEAKLITIKNIIDKGYIYYMYYKDYTLSFSRNIINTSIEVIFYKYLLFSTNLSIFNIEVKKKLLYLSIIPVYRAKLKESVFQFLVHNRDNKIYSLYMLSNLFNNCDDILFNHNFIQIIVDKLQCSKSISQLIVNFLYSGDIYSSFNMRNINFQQCLISKPNKVKSLFISSFNLIDLIFNILVLDKSWFCFKTQLKKSDTQNLKICNCKSMISNISSISSEIRRQISFFIYDKIYHRFRLIRTLNCRNNFIDYLIRIYLRYYEKSKKILSLNLMKHYHQFINVLLYASQKRRNKLNQLRKIVSLNYSVNLYINYYNLMNFGSF